jgi:Domain of unknown function (DUF4232)
MFGMSIVPPPAPPRPDELEALIREARARQRRRRLVGVVAVGAVAGIGLSVWAAVPGGTGTKQPEHTRSARPPAIAPCSPARLRISLARRFAGLGHVNGDLRFTNLGATRCRLSGWPSVAAVEANGKTIRARRIPALWMAWALSWPRSRAARPVVLGQGRSADAEIDGGDVAVGNQTTCPTARWLRVAAPGTRHSVAIPAVWWKSAGRPVYYSLCGGIAVTRFFPPSALPH